MGTDAMFRTLLKEVLEIKGLSQHQLAMHAEVSQTAISLLGNHQRKLTDELAEKLARILGGTQEMWLEANEDFRQNRPKPLNSYLDKIGGGKSYSKNFGVGMRRMLNNDMLRLFWKESDRTDCVIRGFDPRRVHEAHYYSRVGFIGKNLLKPKEPIREPFKLEPDEIFVATTLEEFTFPLWLEAKIHPASNIADKGISVVHGPTIDAGYDKGWLRVSVMNKSNEPQYLDPNEHFLKLHFDVFDVAARSPKELRQEFGPIEVSDDEIYASCASSVLD